MSGRDPAPEDYRPPAPYRPPLPLYTNAEALRERLRPEGPASPAILPTGANRQERRRAAKRERGA